MLPDRSRTRDVPTVGFATTVAVTGTVKTSPVSVMVTVSVPESVEPALPGEYSTHTSRSLTSNPSGSSEVTEVASTVNGAVTEAVAVTGIQPRTRNRRARAVGRFSTTSRKRTGSPGTGDACSTDSGRVS